MHINFKQLPLKTALVSAFALGAAAFGVNAYAATATANATATVIAPMTLTKTLDLRFGKFAPGLTTGTVVIAAGGARSATGGVKVSALDAGGAASYSVTGDSTATYAITLPTGTATITSGVNTMSVATFTSAPSATGTLTAGAQTLTVGGTLSVAISQVAGAYTGTYDVTVEYN